MSEHTSNFELPKNIEHYLATLSKLYAHEGKRQFQEIIVNAQIRVHEEWDYDNLLVAFVSGVSTAACERLNIFISRSQKIEEIEPLVFTRAPEFLNQS